MYAQKARPTANSRLANSSFRLVGPQCCVCLLLFNVYVSTYVFNGKTEKLVFSVQLSCGSTSKYVSVTLHHTMLS